MSRFIEIRDQVRQDFPNTPWIDYALRPLSYTTSGGMVMDCGKSAVVATSLDGQEETVCGVVNPDCFRIYQPELVLHDTLEQLIDLGFGTPKVSGIVKGAYFRFQLSFAEQEAVAKGDLVSPMVILKGAQTGKNSVKLIPGALQLVCTNGLISPTLGSMFRVIHQFNHRQGQLHIAVEQVRQYLEIEFANQVMFWRSLAEKEITFEQITDMFALPEFPLGGTVTRGALKRVLSLVMPQKGTSLNNLLAQKSASVWDFHNAVTQYTSHEVKSIQSLNKQEQAIAHTFRTLF